MQRGALISEEFKTELGPGELVSDKWWRFLQTSGSEASNPANENVSPPVRAGPSSQWDLVPVFWRQGLGGF